MGTRSARGKSGKAIAQTPKGELIAFEHAELHAGILPPPEEMAAYETMCPGVTKVLIDTYTAQVNHRIQLEKTVIEGDNKRSNRGQIISAALAFVCIGLGGVLTYMDKNIGGLALIFGSLGTLLTAFYGGAIIRKNERIEKNQQSSP